MASSDKERIALCGFLSKHLQCEFPEVNSLLGTLNDVRYKKFVRKIVLKISSEIFIVVRERAVELRLCTYELRHGSKAEIVFLGGADIPAEEVLWKELLIFFMNTKQNSGYLRFLRSITPLDFDSGEVAEYLDCFQSDAAKVFVIDELEHHYAELEGEKSDRLRQINAIGDPGISFDDDEDEKGELGAR